MKEEIWMAFIIGIVLSFFVTGLTMKTFVVEPMKDKIIEKGYASYQLKNPKEPNSYELVWKE